MSCTKKMRTWVTVIAIVAAAACTSAVFLVGCGKKEKCPGCGTELVNDVCPDICTNCKVFHLKDGKCQNPGCKPPVDVKPVCPECKMPKDKEGKCNCQKRESVSPTVVDRVHNRTMKAWVQMTGRGSDADWGIQSEANFKYNVLILSESRIAEKTKLPSGGIRVVEIRKFNTVTDSLTLSDIDFRLNLDTLPVETFDKAANLAIDICSSIFGVPGKPVKFVKDQVGKMVKTIEKVSIKEFLRSVGFDLTPEIEQIALQLCGNGPLKGFVKGKFKEIQGKSYRITYIQDSNSTPLLFTFTYEDGSPVTSDEENMILSRVNALIDHHSVPNINCNPGDSWTISAENIQECFDPYVAGTYSGKIDVTRLSNDKEKNWVLSMSPSQINVLGDHGDTTGTLKLKSGRAVVNPNTYSVSDVCVSGEGKLKKLSKHHILFKSHVNGWCKFQGRLVSVVED